MVEVDRWISRLARQGLVRASARLVIELGALAQSAQNAGMVKVQRDLDALATVVGHYLDRDPNFTEVRYSSLLAQLWRHNREAALASDQGVDPRELKALLGEARRTYELVEEPLELQALAAHGWVTDSDFMGITVHLQGPDGLLTVSQARPVAVFGNEPRRLMRQGISDYLTLTLEDLAHGAHTFHNAKRSEDGRLSVHKDLDLGPGVWSAHAFAGRTVSVWRDLVPMLRASEASILVLVLNAGPKLVLLDHKASVCTARFEDEEGSLLQVRLPLRPENNLWVDNLQTLTRPHDLAVLGFVGRVTATARGLLFDPYTLVTDGPIQRRGRFVNEVHLSLEDLERR